VRAGLPPRGVVLRVGLLLAFILTACGAPPSTGQSTDVPSASEVARAPKVLNVVLVGEPRALTVWQESTTGGVVNIHELITTGLVTLNGNSEPIPRLAVEVPSIDKGTWRVNPDETMETTYRLRPDAVWHDGTSVTAADVVFSAKVQLDPRIDMNPVHRGLVTGGLERTSILDDRTVVFHWSRPFGFADSLSFWDFVPLPSSLLEAAYERDPQELSQHPYWSDENVFMGTGPYRLTRWERGSMLDFQAFDRYFLGKPNVDRILVNIVQDNNTGIARVLGGDIDLAWGVNWDLQGMDLVRSRGIGDFVIGSEGTNHMVFQFKDIAQPIDLARDVRLRRALAHATNRDGINQVDADGMSGPADSWIPPSDPRYREAEPFITRYPHDPQRAAALFAEAGWTRGGDGVLRNREGAAFTCEIRGQLGKRSGEVTADAWRSIGIDAVAEERPAGIERDLAIRATFKCVEESFRSLGRISIIHLHSNNAMIPERRYVGSNRGAYMNPELDRLIDAFFSAATQTARLEQERGIVRVVTTDLPMVTTIFDVRKDFQKTGVSGTVIKTGLNIVNSRTWNVHEWTKA
jgi:peptide/nickel transport system substrate-binding protein